MSVALQLSCITRHYYPETVENLKKLCAILSIEFQEIENATCCGLPYFEKGELKTAKTIGSMNLTLYEHKQIMSCSSKCESVFTHMYPKLFNNTVSHNQAVQLSKNTTGLSDLLDKLPSEYFESLHGNYFLVENCCSKTRLKPYTLLAKNCEWSFPLIQATCCGAGTSLPTFNQNLSTELTKQLLDDFSNSKADYIVFEDDICRKQVEIVASKQNMSIKTLNFIDFLTLNQNG
ncbi:MAG: (Fe-S)-binding protein [Bacteroidia bacterium]